MNLQLFSFVFYSFLSFSNAAEPQKIPPKEGEIGDFFWRPATADIVKVMKNSMNQSADPCEDFYEFACGNFGKMTNYSMNGEINRKMKDHIKDLLINEMPRISDSKMVESTNKIMQSCLKFKRTDTMSDIFNNYVETYSKLSLIETNRILAKLDIQTTYRVQVMRLGSGNIILIVPPKDKLTRSANLPFINSTIEKIIKDETLAEGVKEFTKKLIEIVEPSANRLRMYEFSHFDLPEPMIQKLVSGDIFEHVGLDILDMLPSLLHFSDFYGKLDKLINETDEEVVKAHSLMKLTYSLALTATDGIEESVEDACSEFITQRFPIVVISALSEKLLPNESRNGVNDVHFNILDSLESTLKHQDWLGLSTQNAIKKIHEGATWFGLPERLFDYRNLDSSLFGAMVVDESHEFPELCVDVLQYKQKEKLAMMKGSKEEVILHWAETENMVDVNAFNAGGQDVTMYNMAMLQSPFFHYRFPDFYRYGAFGFVFGHEYGHGLASERTPGPYFTDGGSVSQGGNEEFARRADCLVDQFNNDTLTTVEGKTHKINGKQYLNENIADNSGYYVTFKAYKKATESQRRPKRISELDEYTEDQMFFVSSAQFFCTNVDEAHWNQLSTNEHAPNPIRVNAVRNSDDFAKAFKCPVGSKMNPPKKCRLWD